MVQALAVTRVREKWKEKKTEKRNESEARAVLEEGVLGLRAKGREREFPPQASSRQGKSRLGLPFTQS